MPELSKGWRQELEAALLKIENSKDRAARINSATTICELAQAVTVEEQAEFAPALGRLIADKDPQLRAQGAMLAGIILPPKDAAELLLRHVGDKDELVRTWATGTLADLALPELRHTFARLIDDESERVRFEAARGMAVLKHPAGLEVLCKALDNDELRYQSVNALVELGYAEALPALRRQFERWFLPTFDRTQIAGAMARLGDDRGVAHLFKRTEKKWSADKAMAVELLGEVKAKGAKERLLELLGDKKEATRGAAARGLGLFGDQSVVPNLLPLLADPASDEELKLDVAEALWLLNTPDARAAVQALSLQSSEAQAELKEILAIP